MTSKELMEMSPMDLNAFLQKSYRIEIPEAINNADDLKKAGELLSKYSSLYSYFSQMALTAKIMKRNYKAEKADKNIVNDALSREEILSLYADLMKQSYNTISRLITIKLAVNEELKFKY